MSSATGGNRGRISYDYPRMSEVFVSCDSVREALSARMDGEESGRDRAVIQAHLPGCRACRAWLTSAEQVTRIARLQPVEVPDLTRAILAAAAREHDRTNSAVRAALAARRQILRVAIGLTAVAQVLLAVPALLAGLGVSGVVDPHLSREAASFDIALAVGFALAAWWPQRARAFVPVAFVLALCLTVTSAFDIAGGVTGAAHEVGHAVALVQAGLLWALSRYADRSTHGTGRTATVSP